jgi:hypothetical protein
MESRMQLLHVVHMGKTRNKDKISSRKTWIEKLGYVHDCNINKKFWEELNRLLSFHYNQSISYKKKITYLSWSEKNDTIWGAAVLVLLIRVIYEVWRWYNLKRKVKHTKFYDARFKHSCNINVISSKIWEAVMLVLLLNRAYEYSFEMASAGRIYVSSLFYLMSHRLISWSLLHLSAKPHVSCFVVHNKTVSRSIKFLKFGKIQ